MGAFPYTQFKNVNNRTVATKVRPAIQSVPCLVWGQAGGGGDGNLAKLKRNFADRTQFLQVGTPVLPGSGIARFKGATNFLQSNAFETNEFTFCALARNADTSADNATTGALMGSYSGSVGYGVLIYWQSANVIRAQIVQGTSTVRSITLTVADPTAWNFFRIECKMTSGTAGTLTLFNDTDGTSAVQTITAARVLGILPIAFGSSRSVSFLGLTEMNHWSFYSGIATAAEVAALRVQVLQIAADMGIVENA